VSTLFLEHIKLDKAKFH